MNIKFWI